MTLEVETQSGEKFVGSAVLVLADDVAVTAWHVVADARSVWAVFADGQRVKVTGCIDHASGRDLALLKLEKGRPHRRAILCRELQPVAARAYAVGAPRGFEFSITDGLISQVRTVNGLLQYQVSCPISPGNSGGPILNQRGEVIGIATWTKADAQNVNFQYFKPLLKTAGLPPKVRLYDLRHLPLRAQLRSGRRADQLHPQQRQDRYRRLHGRDDLLCVRRH